MLKYSHDLQDDSDIATWGSKEDIASKEMEIRGVPNNSNYNYLTLFWFES